MKGRDAIPHLGIFGRRSNGKSSLINALSAQEVALVSKRPGTATDPVKKSMEIPDIGLLGREKGVKVGANIIMPDITPGVDGAINLADGEIGYGEWGDSMHIFKRIANG